MEERENFEKIDVNDVESILEEASKDKLPRKQEKVEEINETKELVEKHETEIVKPVEEANYIQIEENKGEKQEAPEEPIVKIEQTIEKISEANPKETLPYTEVKQEEKKTAGNEKPYVVKDFKKGDIVKVTVVKIEPNGILVSAGIKEDIFIPIHGLSIKPINSAEQLFKVGDKIDVYVMRDASAGGTLSLSKKLADYQKKWDELKSKFQRTEKVTGIPVKEIKGGLLVDIDGISAFLPQSQIGLKKGETAKDFIGKPTELYIVEFDKSLKRVVVSRLKVLSERKDEERKKALVEIKKGEIYDGIVRSIQDFGVFVELRSGLEGLVRLNELTWGRRRPPNEIVRNGEHIKVKVLNVNLDNGKIALSIRQTKPYPWDVVDVKYPVDSIVEGPVIRIHEFGAVVELEDGLTGLIHISQLDNKRVNKVEEIVKVGDIVRAKVISIDKENKKIKLSRKAAIEENS